MKLLILIGSVLTSALADENFGAGNLGQYVSNGDDGRYYPDNSGQYIPDDSGRYIPDGTGGYVDDGTGRYSGQKDGYSDRNGKFGSLNNGNLLGLGTSKEQVIRPTPSNIVTTAKPRQQFPDYKIKSNNYQDGKWKIIRQLSDIDPDGYHWEYETENKIVAEESGKLYNKGTDAEAIRAKGFFQYVGPDNVLYSITYTADENGFVPVGDHLPTPPPIPAAIAKALEEDKTSSNNKLYQ